MNPTHGSTLPPKNIWPGRDSSACCVRDTCHPRRARRHLSSFLRSFFLFLFFSHFYFPASGQAVVTGVVHSPPRFLPSIIIAHRVQQSHYSSIFHRVLLTHALALSASQFVHKKKSQRIYTSVHSAGLELTKLTDTRLEDNLICHRGDRLYVPVSPVSRAGRCKPRPVALVPTLRSSRPLPPSLVLLASALSGNIIPGHMFLFK